MRHYWIPALLSAELAPGGRVKRVRLLGEDLVAFRAPDGTVGLLGEFCSHRGRLALLRAQRAAGLRCVYHGWNTAATGSAWTCRTSRRPAASRRRFAIPPIPAPSAAASSGRTWARPALRPRCRSSNGRWCRTRTGSSRSSTRSATISRRSKAASTRRTSRSCTACSTRVTRRCATWTGRRPGSPWPRSWRRRRRSRWSTRPTAR